MKRTGRDPQLRHQCEMFGLPIAILHAVISRIKARLSHHARKLGNNEHLESSRRAAGFRRSVGVGGVGDQWVDDRNGFSIP